jgi:hypothetical protein
LSCLFVTLTSPVTAPIDGLVNRATICLTAVRGRIVSESVVTMSSPATSSSTERWASRFPRFCREHDAKTFRCEFLEHLDEVAAVRRAIVDDERLQPRIVLGVDRPQAPMEHRQVLVIDGNNEGDEGCPARWRLRVPLLLAVVEVAEDDLYCKVRERHQAVDEQIRRKDVHISSAARRGCPTLNPWT